jgi:tetratricopeptide (TPR) repeat protein
MAETSKPAKPIEVFFSYSHKDEELRDQLSNHLSTLKRKQFITAWHDRRIGAGTEWANEIDERLDAADIILLLISSDFLASDYCYDIEVKRAMERHDAGEARVIPVILRPVDWKGAPFGKLQALPRDARPVTEWPNRDQALLDIAQGIRAAAEELAFSQHQRLFASFAKVESLGNWANVISLGERLLQSIPDHLPECQSLRSRIAAAYVKRWKRCFDERHQDMVGCLSIKTKRNEDQSQVIDQILADLDRAIQLEPENAEYHYIHFSVLRERNRGDDANAALERAIELDPSTAQYYFARSIWKWKYRDETKAARDHQRAVELGYEPPAIFTGKAPKKERWRLRCLE